MHHSKLRTCSGSPWTKGCKEKVPVEIYRCHKCFSLYRKHRAHTRKNRDKIRAKRLRLENSIALNKLKNPPKAKQSQAATEPTPPPRKKTILRRKEDSWHKELLAALIL